jgi:chromosomal replication initiator protein
VDISVETLWAMVLELLQSQLSHPTFEAWIKTATAEELTSERLVIRTPHPFARNWLVKYYLPSISTSVAEILGYPVEVQILACQTNTDLGKDQDDINIIDQSLIPSHLNLDVSLVNPLNPLPNSRDFSKDAKEAIAPRTSNLNPKYVFSRFVVGATSRMAHAAALAVAESPGREFNPLFLCGGVGLGKTHLMQAIAHYRLEIAPDARIAYVSTEQFTNDLITAIRKDSMQAFRENYRDVDMILVDDIQFIEGKEYTQEEFFHTFNALYEKGKQVIIASDRPPAQIPRLQERLSSRFSMGLIADIQVPDLETRTAILQKKAEYENLRIPPEVLHYIAASYTSNVRELEGALVRAVAYISISGLPMTIENVAPILNPPKEPLDISPELVLSVVADFMDIELTELQGSSRRREVSQARQVAMYLMRQHTNLSLPKIGLALGGKDHTTVMYSCEKITKLQAKDAETAQLIRELSDRIYLIAQSDTSKAV